MSWPKTCGQSIKVNFPHRIFLGSEYVITLPKSGDMITAVRLVLSLPTTNNLKERIVNKVEFLVGDDILESITGEFLQILNDFGVNLEKRQAYKTSINGPLVTLDIPFSIIKSGFHVVTPPSIRISLEGRNTNLDEIGGYLLVDYSLIEDPAEKTFAQRVTKNQNIRGIFNGATLVKFDTAFVGPVYHLFFSTKVKGSFVDYIKNVKLVTDGQDRFNLTKQYLRYVEPLKVLKSIAYEPILYYSFCLGGGTSPAGSMNFSRIDTQRFEIELIPNIDQVQVDIWAQSHNFVYFNSSTVLPIFDSHELLLSSSQDKTLTVLSDVPVTLSYRYYLNSVSIFYNTSKNIQITPNLVSSFPNLNIAPLYTPGIITINNIFSNTYLVFKFSAQGYKSVQTAFTIKYINAHPMNFTQGPDQHFDYTEVTDIDIKVNQYPIITMNVGCHPLAGRYMSSMMYDFENGSYIELTDSYSIRKQISETALAIDYGDNFYVAATINRNIYKKNRDIFSNKINGGCIIKYDSNYNPLWAHQLGGTFPSLDYLYPKFYVSSNVPVLGNGDAFITGVFCSWGVTMLVDSYNNLLMAGSNDKGQCGNGSNLTIDAPGFFIPVSCPGVSSFSTGKSHSVIIDLEGSIWATGQNTYGQVGLGDSTQVNVFTQVSVPGITFTRVACGRRFTVALDSTGTIWVTGSNSVGQIGLGGSTQVNVFTQVSVPGVTFTSISSGDGSSAALDFTGSIWVTGNNSVGQIGLGSSQGVNVFTQVSVPGITFTRVACGREFTVALDSTGSIWVTGNNSVGQIGLGSSQGVNVFTQVSVPGVTFTRISCSSLYNTCLVDTNGNLWVTGDNSYSQLGLYPSYDVNSINTFTNIIAVFKPIGLVDPVDLPPPVFVSASFGNYHLVAVDNNGYFWVAGRTGLSLACIGTNQPSHKLLFNKISQLYRGLPNKIELQILDIEGNTTKLAQISADQIKSKNIVVDATGQSYIDVLYSSNSTSGNIPSTGGVLTAAVIQVDENLNVIECVKYGTVNCKSIVDRQNVKYTTYVDDNRNLNLTFLGKTVTVSNIVSTTNFYTEIDFLGNIYLCGTYSSDSRVTPAPPFALPWTSDSNGGTFIMKLNITKPIWIIRIKNTDSTSNNIISRILTNSYTGIIYVVGYLSCVQNQPQYIYDRFGTESSFGPILDSDKNSDGINGFMFSFDPSGYVVPKETSIPPVDFFKIKFQNLIGTHPVETLAVPQFFPPNYVQYPPDSLDPYGGNQIKTISDMPFTNTITGAGFGNGIYSILASSFALGYNYPARAFNLTKGGIDWITSSETYGSNGDATNQRISFMNASPINGEFIALTLPSPIRMDYISFEESAAEVYSEPSSLFVVIGTNSMIQGLSGNITLGGDTAIVYSKTQEIVSPVITSRISAKSIKVQTINNLYQGMIIQGTNIEITNISDDNILSLSAEYNGTTVLFVDTKHKVIKLNTTKPYQTYILCAQKMAVHPNGGTWRITYIVYNSKT